MERKLRQDSTIMTLRHAYSLRNLRGHLGWRKRQQVAAGRVVVYAKVECGETS
jgi:hypothetical protein